MPSDDVPVFNPHLFDDNDDSEDVAYKTFLPSLITKRITPAHAAEALDEWVVREANTQYDRLRQRDRPFDLTPEEKESLYLVGPNPCRHVEMMVGTVAKIISAYPPGHTSQNLLIEFFQALKALPRQKVPNLSFKDHIHELTFDVKLTLWSFGTESVEYLAQKFQREAEELAYPFSEVETPGSESQLRWRNLQSFISRLTALELIDCSVASALPYILPFHHAYPDLEQRRAGGPQRIAGDLFAAACWLEPDVARKWVFNQCKIIGEGDGSCQIWSMDTWNQLKSQMSFISSDWRFEQPTRDLAQSLREKMEAED
ncbi:unnamed protein product [Penicillium bialowiezense]